MPIMNDFVVDKATLSGRELQIRFGNFGWKIFCKDVLVTEGDQLRPPPCLHGNMIADFANQLRNLRLYILKLAKPQILALCIHKFIEAYPDYTFGGGRKVTSF